MTTAPIREADPCRPRWRWLLLTGTRFKISLKRILTFSELQNCENFPQLLWIPDLSFSDSHRPLNAPRLCPARATMSGRPHRPSRPEEELGFGIVESPTNLPTGHTSRLQRSLNGLEAC